MSSHCQMLDNDLLELINYYRNSIIKNNNDKEEIKKIDFTYNNNDYVLFSLLPQIPYLQIVGVYGDGKKINQSYLVVGCYYCSIPRAIGKKIISSIRKYNTLVYANKHNNNDLSLSIPVEVLEPLYQSQCSKYSDEDPYIQYVNYCKRIDEQRTIQKNKKRKRVVILK